MIISEKELKFFIKKAILECRLDIINEQIQSVYEAKKGGVTPGLNKEVTKRAREIANEKGLEGSMEAFNKAYFEAIRDFGYTPSYFISQIKRIGSEYPGDEFDDDYIDY